MEYAENYNANLNGLKQVSWSTTPKPFSADDLWLTLDISKAPSWVDLKGLIDAITPFNIKPVIGFESLKFNKKKSGNGIQALFFFPNGYGVSVIGGMFQNEPLLKDTTEDGVTQFEIAVLKGTADDYHIWYNSPVTDDVLRYQTKEDVSRVMKEVENLPRINNTQLVSSWGDHLDKPREMSRVEANRKILDILKSQVESNPDYRFGQLLYNIGVATHCLEANLEDIPKIQELLEDIYSDVQKPNRSENLEQHTPRYRDIFFEESTETLKKMINEISGN